MKTWLAPVLTTCGPLGKIVPFRPLSKDVMKGVVAMKLDKIAQRLAKAHGITLSCSPALVDHIADCCTAIEAGAKKVVVLELMSYCDSSMALVNVGPAFAGTDSLPKLQLTYSYTINKRLRSATREVPLPVERGWNGAKGETSIRLGLPPSTTTE